MALRVKVKQTGGKRLQRILREAGKGGVSGVEVGFFSTAKYQDGTPVAAVAAWNEFGTKRPSGETHIPERPFFRQAIAEMQDGVINILKAGIDPERGVVDQQLANRIGAYAQRQVQRRITELDDPPNAPSTVDRKGPSNPLIDTNHMRQSVTWKVN